MVDSVSTNCADIAQTGAMSVPPLDQKSALVFVVNAASGASDTDAKRAVIEAALAARGRKGELLICGPDELHRVATKAAAAAAATHTAVIAVGGDGSLNAVAQAAHAAGCPMGVIPYGTFNYFARTHGIPTDPAAAARMLFDARPLPVQVAAINDRLLRLKLHRYMTTKVPTSDTGTATLGINVARALRRNRNTTKITSATEMIRVNSASCSEERMFGLRSSITRMAARAPRVSRSCGNSA